MQTTFLRIVGLALSCVLLSAGACHRGVEWEGSADAGLALGAPCSLDSECDDGVACNGTEVCAEGVCAAGVPPDCDDGNDCTLDTCDASGCVHNAYGTAHACSQQPLGYCHGATCMSGIGTECNTSTPCSPSNNDCTQVNCENGYCLEYARLDGTACLNGNGDVAKCYQGACEECVDSTTCDDGNNCTIDVCTSVGACVHESNDLATCAGGFCWRNACCGGCIDHQQPDPETGLGACVSPAECTSGLGCNEDNVCN